MAGLPPPGLVKMPGHNSVRRHRPGGLLTLVQTEGAHHGLHHYPSGTDLARAEDPGGHRAQRLGVTWGLEAAGLGAASAVGGPAPSTRRQWLARLTAGGSLGSPPGSPRACAQLEDNSGSPGSLRGTTTAAACQAHCRGFSRVPARRSSGPRPARRQQRLARLAEGSVLGAPPVSIISKLSHIQIVIYHLGHSKYVYIYIKCNWYLPQVAS